MTEAQIKHMVDRFLGWGLPEDFHPDAGISFKKTFNDHMPHPMRHEPIGTNLFTATQADAMVRYMLEGMSAVTEQRGIRTMTIDDQIAYIRVLEDVVDGLISRTPYDSDAKRLVDALGPELTAVDVFRKIRRASAFTPALCTPTENKGEIT